MPPKPRQAWRPPVGLALALMTTLLPLSRLTPPSTSTRPGPTRPPTEHVLFFVSDGGQPDFYRQFAAEGRLPAFARLEADGAMAPTGMIPQLPTSTRPGWQTLSTGAWSGTHGSINNVFTRHGQGMAESSPFGAYSPLEAETLPEAAQRAGLKVLMYDWNSSDQPAIDAPAVKYWRTYSRTGVAQNYDDPRAAAEAQAWGLMFDRLTLSPVSADPGAPRSFSRLMGTTLRLADITGAAYEYPVRFYDSTNDGEINYDRAAITSAGQPVADLGVGEWAEVRLKLPSGVDKGKAVGFYVKLMALGPGLSQVKFFITAISRVNAQPAALEDYLAEHFPTRTGASGALAWAGLIDEATYAEANALTLPFNRAALPWLLNDYAPDTNLALVGYLNTDIIQHAVLALITPGSPVYDDADRDGRPDGMLDARWGFLRDTYAGADETLAAAWDAMPADTVVVAASDHGFAPTWKAVYAPRVLADLSLQPDPQNQNCVASDRVLAKGCWVGGALMIYMNVVGREPEGVVAKADYPAVRDRIVAAWKNLKDTDGTPIAAAVYTAEAAAALPDGWATASMAHADKTGDVLVFLNLPYQFDFAEGGTPVRDTNVWWAAHGHLPQSGQGRPLANLYATFYMAGPLIRHARPTYARSIDMAPTLAYLLGIPKPAQAEGRVLYELLRGLPCRVVDSGTIFAACVKGRR